MRLKARFNSLREYHFKIHSKGESVKFAICVECEEEYPIKRKQLGYRTCLDCGERSAVRIASKRTQQNLREMAPHHYTGSVDDLFDERGGY